MAGIRTIAEEYRDEIMDGIAWVAVWKTGKSWSAKAFWLDHDDMIEANDVEEVKGILAEDASAVFINEYYCAHMGEGTLEDIVAGIRFHYESGNNKLSEWPTAGSKENAAENHELWLFDLAHGNLSEQQILQGFIKYYVLEGHMMSRIQDDLVYRTQYGCYYAGAVMDQLKSVLEKAAEGRY